MKFSDYKNQRELLEFNNKIDQFCQKLVTENIDFDIFWQQHALPIFLNKESHISNEEELILEFWNWFNKKKPNNQTTNYSEPDYVDYKSPVNPDFLNYRPPVQQSNPIDDRRQQKMARFQQKVDQQISNVKQRFQVAMKDFLKAVTDDAKNQNDPHMWQIAKSFYNRLLKATEPVLNQFKLNVQMGRGAYQDQFAKEAGQMQNSRQASALQNLRDRNDRYKQKQNLVNQISNSTGLSKDRLNLFPTQDLMKHKTLNTSSPEIQNSQENQVTPFDKTSIDNFLKSPGITPDQRMKKRILKRWITDGQKISLQDFFNKYNELKSQGLNDSDIMYYYYNNGNNNDEW